MNVTDSTESSCLGTTDLSLMPRLHIDLRVYKNLISQSNISITRFQLPLCFVEVAMNESERDGHGVHGLNCPPAINPLT